MRSIKHFVLITLLGIFALGLTSAHLAIAEPDAAPVVVDAAVLTPAVTPASTSTDTTATPAPPPSLGDVLGQLGDLKAQYDALKANKDKSLVTLLWVGLIAALLKVLLSAMNAIWPTPKKWTAWIALGLAVPIALLSHFAAGHGWVDSAVFALAGPGAIAIHELLKLFTKKPAEATA